VKGGHVSQQEPVEQLLEQHPRNIFKDGTGHSGMSIVMVFEGWEELPECRCISGFWSIFVILDSTARSE
jgi:hypothetical protein